MTFNSREIFPCTPNWAQFPAGRFHYDRRELQIGHGAPRLAQTQLNVAHHWSFTVTLPDEQSIADFDAFTAALLGPLNGFWLPSPLRAATIVAGVSTSAFDIAGQSLAVTWQNRPAVYLWFTKDGQTSQPAQITSVGDNGNGTERVTLTGPLDVAVDATWSCNRLLYVRLAGDQEEGTFIQEQQMHRKVEVVELPEEYAAVETGQQPVYLYHFSADYAGTVVHWRFTSFPADLVSNGETFSTAPINHGALKRSLRGQIEAVDLTAVYQAGNPLNHFFPFASTRPLTLEILEAPYAIPSDTTVLFTGRVGRPKKVGLKITARVESLIDALRRKIPGLTIQPKCNYQLYDADTCKVNPATYAKDCTLTTLTANQVIVTGAALIGTEESWFALGWLRTGTGADLQLRDILASSAATAGGAVTLWLSHPLSPAAVATQAATLHPGCNKMMTGDCRVKFANGDNFGGHPVVPVQNLSVKAIPQGTANGNKK